MLDFKRTIFVVFNFYHTTRLLNSLISYTIECIVEWRLDTHGGVDVHMQSCLTLSVAIACLIGIARNTNWIKLDNCSPLTLNTISMRPFYYTTNSYIFHNGRFKVLTSCSSTVSDNQVPVTTCSNISSQPIVSHL